MKTILFVILAIIQVVIALLPSLGKLYREENGPFSYKTTVWGKLLHIACILGLLFTIGLYLYTQEEEENSRKSLTMGLSQRDSLHRIHLDSIQNNTIELLAKYGYKVDSSNNQIIKAIDISKVNIESPLIEVCKDGIKGLHKTNDSLYFNLSLCNKKNDIAAYNIKVKYRVIIKSNGNYIATDEIGLFPFIPVLAPKEFKETSLRFKMNGIGNNLIFDTIFLAINGTYTNYNNTINPLPTINEFNVIIPDKNFWGEWDYRLDPKLYSYLKQNNIRN